MKEYTIALVNQAFQMDYYSRRWKLFAEEYKNVDVWLFTPETHVWYKGKGYTWGKPMVMKGKDYDDENYHVRTFKSITIYNFGFISLELSRHLKKTNPDFVYLIGGHNDLSIVQTLLLKKWCLHKTKVAAFSMRGPAMNLKLNRSKCNPIRFLMRKLLYELRKTEWRYIRRNIDAIMCHYPGAVECFKQEGYEGPIYMQTQVGVNSEWFHKDDEKRKEIRKKYNIKDSTYVFGSATRFTVDKGVDIILKALPVEGDWCYLMMGSGLDSEHDRIRKIIKERNIGNKVIETGFIDWKEIGKYWNAVDCAIHVPLTTEFWEETFSLAAIQPQITGKPVIGDTSGSVPYQVGYEDMIVPENDVQSLRQKIEWVLANKEKAASIGMKMYQRTLNGFEVKHLNELFYYTFTEDILHGLYDPQKFDMVNYKHL